jgi:signal transduction histidine kinase/DNA-binding response OmpR family regulator
MASPVPPSPVPQTARSGEHLANVPVDDAAEAARRFRRFVLLDLAAASVGVVVIAVVILVVRTPLAWPLLVATVLCVGLLAWSLPLYRAGRVDAAVLAVCATFWLQLVVAPLVVPSLFGGFAVLTVFPVLFAIPYVQRRTLLVISVATAIAAVVAVLLAMRAIVPVVSGLPTLLIQVLFVCVSIAFLGLGLTVLYAYSGRLAEVVDGLRHANEALHRSERSLEQKVVDRTAELEHSREETARARDEAVGLSHELAAVLDNLGEGLLVIDAAGRVERVNRRLEEMLGRPSGSLLDQAAAQVLPELDGIGSTLAATREIPLAQGRLGRAVASAIVDPSEGVARGTVVLVRDITVEREVDRMKTDFISTVSHELRTPLTSILGFTKIIAKRLDERVYPAVPDPDPATDRAMTQVRGNLDIIVTEGERLTALINDLLDLAKMEAGRVEWRDEEVDVDAVVRRVAATVQPLFEEKDLPLELELEPELPPVRGDRHRLEQVVINLLSNASKFTETGVVTVRTRREATEVVVSVADTGPGIAPADRGDLFVRFKQVGDTLTGKPQGTGLGLPICKEIVEHHGGHLDVESEVGQGTTFSFTLPLPIGRAEPPATPVFRAPVVDAGTLLRDLRDTFEARRTDGPPHILVVDDHQPVRQLLRQELEGHGYVVHEAADGHEGFRMARALGPDLVTLDVMMPDVNGFDVAAALRQDPATMRIPLMMISVVHDEGRARAVGVDSYLTKPIDSGDLLEQVETLLAQGSTQRQVVVADPDSSMVETLGSALAAHGWLVTPASNPDTVVEVVREHAPDVVIARVDPADPSRLVDELRADPETEHAVVVLYE